MCGVCARPSKLLNARTTGAGTQAPAPLEAGSRTRKGRKRKKKGGEDEEAPPAS
jgi:hypothetical protein